MPAVLLARLEYDNERRTFYVDFSLLVERYRQIQHGNRVYGKLDFIEIDGKYRQELGEDVNLNIRFDREKSVSR